ncbi:hypothetical protein ACHAW6_009047 [Cyclotella cf. meneghiniana]
MVQHGSTLWGAASTASTSSPPQLPELTIADTGASGHYFLPHTPLTNVNANAPCTTIRTATGQPLLSTGTATLNLPDLPPDAWHGHIVPGLTHNLLSIGMLCDAGCTACFIANTLTITNKAGTVILSGTHDTSEPPLWRVILTPPHHSLALHIARPHDTGCFQPRAHSGNQCIIIALHADTNAILVRPFPSKHDAHHIAAYQDIHAHFSTANHMPIVHILDNEASAAYKHAITTNGCTFQLIPPIHCQNAAKHAIRTFKDHFLAVLAGTAPSFPADRWDLLLPHAELILNLLCSSHCNPTLSTWDDLFGTLNFDATPLGPVG